jgi:hypothetical protein
VNPRIRSAPAFRSVITPARSAEMIAFGPDRIAVANNVSSISLPYTGMNCARSDHRRARFRAGTIADRPPRQV